MFVGNDNQFVDVSKNADVLKWRAIWMEQARVEGYRQGWLACRAVLGGAILSFHKKAKTSQIKGLITRIYTLTRDVEPPLAYREKVDTAAQPAVK